MARLIEIGSSGGLPERLEVASGDLLRFQASGGLVRSGQDAMALLGVYAVGVVGNHGLILSPEGAPGIVLFQARNQGEAVIRVVAGSPWGKSDASEIAVTVKA